MPTATAGHPPAVVYHDRMDPKPAPETCRCGHVHRGTPLGTVAVVTVTHCSPTLTNRFKSGETKLDQVQRLDAASGRYLQTYGECPVCNAEAGLRPANEPFRTEGEEVLRDCCCPACGETWTEVLAVIGIRDVRTGER